MTKDELLAANERLGKEVAALRDLLAVIGTAQPPWHADKGSDLDQNRYYRECRSRLANVAIFASSAMGYAGERCFPQVVHNTAASLRQELARPLSYVPESAEREPQQVTA